MNKLKVVTLVGTRPEIIRLSRLIPALDEATQHIFVHTGQNSDPQLNDVFYRDLGLRLPDYFLGVDTSTMGAVMGETLRKAEETFLRERPDAVMILGDTNSAIAAIVAERLGFPVYHMEAGNRSFDNNVPEELNRKMVDHVASFNLPYNDFSMRNLLAEGLHPRFIQKTGSPIREILSFYGEKIAASTVVEDLGLTAGGYFLASVHRQENVDLPDRLATVLDCLVAVRDKWRLPVLVSTHPRTRNRLQGVNRGDLEGINFHEPFGFLDYNKLQFQAKCVISDSGTISEEAAIGNFPAVSLRDSSERPEALETGSMILSGLDPTNLIRSIQLVLSSSSPTSLPEGYDTSDFSQRVLKFVVSTALQHKNWKNLRQ